MVIPIGWGLISRLPPDPEEFNEKRAAAAERALLSFARHFGETDQEGTLGVFAEQNLVDLLADLAHYCDRSKLDLRKCCVMASGLYLEETDGNGEQFADFHAVMAD
jgi:hypothetical protein